MKYNLETQLKTLDGSDLISENGDVVRVKNLLVNALLARYGDEAHLSGEDKMNRYHLAQRLFAGGEQNLSPEEVVLLKKLIGKGYDALIVGQVFDFLNV